MLDILPQTTTAPNNFSFFTIHRDMEKESLNNRRTYGQRRLVKYLSLNQVSSGMKDIIVYIP